MRQDTACRFVKQLDKYVEEKSVDVYYTARYHFGSEKSH